MPETEIELLKRIQGSLVEIRAILALANQEKLAEAKKKLLPENSTKLQVYNMCDGSMTTQEIATATQKPESTIRRTISDLRQDGLVRSLERDDKQVHEQIF
jgi:DNA-binding transcriptional ArsR family regulator